MGLAKLLQTIGRAVRLYKPDPSKKPCAWISVPVVNNNEDEKERIAFVVRTLRNGGFDISKEDIHETKSNRHESEDEGMDDAFDNNNSNFNPYFDIDQIFHVIEDDEFWIKVQEQSSVPEKIDSFFEES
jgi:hypothetical protein